MAKGGRMGGEQELSQDIVSTFAIQYVCVWLDMNLSLRQVAKQFLILVLNLWTTWLREENKLDMKTNGTC